jgi:hypothetical protein
MMGYNFYVNSYKVTASAGKPTVQVLIENRSVAPIYADWKVEVAVLNSSGTFISLGSAFVWNLSKNMPGK